MPNWGRLCILHLLLGRLAELLLTADLLAAVAATAAAGAAVGLAAAGRFPGFFLGLSLFFLGFSLFFVLNPANTFCGLFEGFPGLSLVFLCFS